MAVTKVFKDVTKTNFNIGFRIANGVHFYITAALASEQKTVEAAKNWQILFDADA